MRETGKHYIAIIVALLIFLPVISSGTEDTYKIAYIEGDPYVNYAGTLYGLAMGLSDRGMIKKTASPKYEDGGVDARPVWNWLCENARGKLEFSKDDFYQLVNMSDSDKSEFKRRMNEDGDVDLILVMGTSAAEFIKEQNIKTNVMVMSVTDAVSTGIVKGTNKSGIENIWAHTSPERYIYQMRVFYSLFHFDRLGIVYEDSQNGRNEISYDAIKSFAEQNGVKLVEVPVKAKLQDGAEEYENKMIQGYNSLAGRVDAVYMTNCGNRTGSRMMEYLDPLYKQGIPVFSQTGRNDVANGAVMTVYRSDFNEIGSFCADRLLQIKNGKKPGELSQICNESQTFCINIAAADRAGIRIPFKVLLQCDTIYNSIGQKEEAR